MSIHSINPRTLGTSSLTNAIFAASAQPEPQIGMGATIIMATDRYAATIVEVTHCSVVIQQDYSERTDRNGMSESQDWAYSPNRKARRETYSLRRHGRYVARGERTNGGTHLVIGERDHYIDPSF